MNRVLLAQQSITNPAVPGIQEIGGTAGNSGTQGAAILGFYIALMIQTALVLGGLALLVYLFLGAIAWITAGGDSGKIEKARDRMIQAAIGMAVLFSIVAIAAFLGPVFGLDLLRPVFVNQLDMPSRSSGPGMFPTPALPFN